MIDKGNIFQSLGESVSADEISNVLVPTVDTVCSLIVFYRLQTVFKVLKKKDTCKITTN